MIRRAWIAGVALALISGCKVKDEPDQTGPDRIAPGTDDERPYVPSAGPTGSDLADDARDDARAERRAERRAADRPDDRGDDDRARVRPPRGEDRLASRQDLQRAIEDADRRIERVRANRDLTDQQERDLDVLERRLREIRRDLGDVKQDDDWERESDQLRNRLRRVVRQIEKAEEDDAA